MSGGENQHSGKGNLEQNFYILFRV